jgi:Carboxypeptidase regulatory-like domain
MKRMFPAQALSILVLVIGALGGVANAQSNRPVVAWESNRVSQSLGDGQIVSPMVVRFRVSTPLTNVSVFVVPEIRRFVTVQPSEFPTLQPEFEYSVSLSFSVPTRAAEGLYDGTIHLRQGSRTIPQTLKVSVNVNYDGNIPSPNAITLSPDSLRLITGAAPNNSGIFFSQRNSELSALRPGTILALPPATAIPGGFLGRITNLNNVGNQLFISTTDASLSDAFTHASVSLDRSLSSDDLSSSFATTQGISFTNQSTRRELNSTANGLTVQLNDLEVYDRIFLDGQITVNPQLHFTFDCNNFHLTQLAFYTQLDESLELTIKSQLQATFFEGEREFARYRWNPIVIWVGWIPVVIVPEASLVARATGTASAGIQVGVNQATTATAGIGFDNGSWHPIAGFSSSFSFSGPMFSVGANIKGLVGPRFKLLLYGVVGPRAEIDAFGEIDVDIFRTPLWRIFGGLEANAGVRLQIFDHTIADQEFPLVIQFRRLIGEGGVAGNGHIIGSVRDAITQQPLPNSVVAVYRDGDLIDSLLTNSSGQFSLPAVVGAVYRFEISHSGYLPVTYNNVSVLPNETKTLDIILQIDTAHSGPGNVSGFVFNAISGTGIQGLTVSLRQGLNSVSGTIVFITSTGPNGAYAFSDLPAGNYTAEASGTGYTNSYFPILCIGGTSTGNQNGVITPVILPGQTRIVLTWGASPSDLDSHFTGPLPDGTRFHMYYPFADSNSGSPWPSIVHLDLDDTSSFGPETTTLLQQMSGVYRFSVHDYTNRNSTTSSGLSNSQAQVRVYRGSNLVATFNVPLGQPGTLWTVFEMDGSTITPINAMSFQSNPVSITAPMRTPVYDTLLMQNLPAKN